MASGNDVPSVTRVSGHLLRANPPRAGPAGGSEGDTQPCGERGDGDAGAGPMPPGLLSHEGQARPETLLASKGAGRGQEVGVCDGGDRGSRPPAAPPLARGHCHHGWVLFAFLLQPR